MKKLFSFFAAASCLLLPLFALAQTTKETVIDSSWLVNKAGTFYQARYQLFTTGEEQTLLNPIGDTATTTTRFRDNIRQVSQTLANDAFIVSGYRNQITELIRFGRTLPGIVGRSPLDTILKERADILKDGWTINSSGTSVGIRFRQTANGSFQWKADTATSWRAAAFLGSIIRINVLNGYTTDFFLTPKGRFQTINGQYSIRQPGDIVARRDAADLPEEVPVAPSSAPEFLPDGTVCSGGLIYKFNAKSKQWTSRALK